MLTIQIRLMCPASEYAEVLPTKLEQAEVMVEELISLVLLQLFGVLIVEKVKISFLEEEQ